MSKRAKVAVFKKKMKSNFNSHSVFISNNFDIFSDNRNNERINHELSASIQLGFFLTNELSSVTFFLQKIIACRSFN